MRQTIRLGTFFGVSVGLNWSVLLILGLFAWDLADYVLPPQAGQPDAGDWLAGAAGALVLLASLLAHELSHSLIAKRNGLGVRSITLFVFGGVAQLEGEAPTPGADFRIAAVGPATSLALAGLFGGLAVALVSAGARGVPVATLSWLWEINLALAIFNLMPAAPLDGGRVLRAGLWRYWHDRPRASLAAARTGRAFGLLLIAVGVFAFFTTGLTGLWSALIGLFLYSAARGEEQHAVAQRLLANQTVGEIMTVAPPSLPGRTTVAELVGRLWGYRGDAVPLTDDNGWLAGLVTADAARAVPADRRTTMALREIAIPLASVPLGRPEESANDLLERMSSRGARAALVVDADGRLAGTVGLTDLGLARD